MQTSFGKGFIGIESKYFDNTDYIDINVRFLDEETVPDILECECTKNSNNEIVSVISKYSLNDHTKIVMFGLIPVCIANPGMTEYGFRKPYSSDEYFRMIYNACNNRDRFSHILYYKIDLDWLYENFMNNNGSISSKDKYITKRIYKRTDMEKHSDHIKFESEVIFDNRGILYGCVNKLDANNYNPILYTMLHTDCKYKPLFFCIPYNNLESTINFEITFVNEHIDGMMFICSNDKDNPSFMDMLYSIDDETSINLKGSEYPIGIGITRDEAIDRLRKTRRFCNKSYTRYFLIYVMNTDYVYDLTKNTGATKISLKLELPNTISSNDYIKLESIETTLKY